MKLIDRRGIFSLKKINKNGQHEKSSNFIILFTGNLSIQCAYIGNWRFRDTHRSLKRDGKYYVHVKNYRSYRKINIYHELFGRMIFCVFFWPSGLCAYIY